MAFEYGSRLNKGDYFSTKIDIENQTAETQGTIDGEYVEFSGGGGGSSDFSTAKVTVTNNVETTLYAPYVIDVDGYKGIFIANSNSGEFDVALYKGMCQAGFFSPTPPTFNVVVTGDITYNEGTFSITGDGTITIS